MYLRELLSLDEGVVGIYGRSGNKTVRKYRCTSGSRKGRIVSSPSTCTAPKRMSSYTSMKKTRGKKGSSMSIKSRRTKKFNAASKRLPRINVGHRRIKPKRRATGRRK